MTFSNLLPAPFTLAICCWKAREAAVAAICCCCDCWAMDMSVGDPSKMSCDTGKNFQGRSDCGHVRVRRFLPGRAVADRSKLHVGVEVMVGEATAAHNCCTSCFCCCESYFRTDKTYHIFSLSSRLPFERLFPSESQQT